MLAAGLLPKPQPARLGDPKLPLTILPSQETPETARGRTQGGQSFAGLGHVPIAMGGVISTTARSFGGAWSPCCRGHGSRHVDRAHQESTHRRASQPHLHAHRELHSPPRHATSRAPPTGLWPHVARPWSGMRLAWSGRGGHPTHWPWPRCSAGVVAVHRKQCAGHPTPAPGPAGTSP